MKKSTTVLILLIVFCICGAVTYYSIKGLNGPKTEEKSAKKKDQEDKNKPEKIEVDESKINDLIDKVKVFEIKGTDIYSDKLTNEDLIWFIYNHERDGIFGDGVSLKDAQAMTKKYLGVEVKEGSMPCPNGGKSEPSLVIFNKDKNVFIYNEEHLGHGGGGTALTTMNKIESINVDGDEVTVKVKKLFSAPFGDTDVSTVYYYDYDSAVDVVASKVAYEDIDEELANDPEFDTGYNRDKSKIDYSKAASYEYKIEVDGDNYVLKSLKKIK